ncbi:MAG: hypothetical protein ACREL7_16280 [Longimicrobiales bacterium]
MAGDPGCTLTIAALHRDMRTEAETPVMRGLCSDAPVSSQFLESGSTGRFPEYHHDHVRMGTPRHMRGATGAERLRSGARHYSQ